MIRHQIFSDPEGWVTGGLAILMEGRPGTGEGSPNIYDFGIVTHIAMLG